MFEDLGIIFYKHEFFRDLYKCGFYNKDFIIEKMYHLSVLIDSYFNKEFIDCDKIINLDKKFDIYKYNYYILKESEVK